MIASLTGQVKTKNDRGIVIDVAGVGYRVHLVKEHTQKLAIGNDTSFLTHLAVRENAFDLYGFENAEMLDYFELLITVPGIGPKSALAVLALAAPEILRRAILADDTTYLTRVSGIGRKSAEKIIVTLKDKLGRLGSAESGLLVGEVEAIEALQALGYTLAEARVALKDTPATADTSEKVRAALKRLGKQ